MTPKISIRESLIVYHAEAFLQTARKLTLLLEQGHFIPEETKQFALEEIALFESMADLIREIGRKQEQG